MLDSIFATFLSLLPPICILYSRCRWLNPPQIFCPSFKPTPHLGLTSCPCSKLSTTEIPSLCENL